MGVLNITISSLKYEHQYNPGRITAELYNGIMKESSDGE